ncbi:MAG TPA: hypothetical protein PKD54_02400 [Pirellulaceae bacterium]|nr:hypothetical protein [Pirellulaceae bacterium]
MIALQDCGHDEITPVQTELELKLTTRIYECAGRLVREIKVSQTADRIIVRGKVQSYYAWQLVQSACLKTLGNAADVSLDCAMTVSNDVMR